MLFEGTLLPASRQATSVALISAGERCRITFGPGFGTLEKPAASSPGWKIAVRPDEGAIVLLSREPLEVEFGPCSVHVEAAAEEFLEAASSAGVPVTSGSPPQRQVDHPPHPPLVRRIEDDGVDLDPFEDPDWLIVERHTDPEAAGMPGAFGDFLVSYGDAVAHDLEDLVERSVQVVQGFPGVRFARHEDHEVIIGWGRPNLAELEEELRRWWAAQASG